MLPKSKRTHPWISLAKISSDSGLTPKVFTDYLLEAWIKGEAVKGKFKILKRGESDGKPAFLFTIKGEIAGQFPLEPSFLNKPTTVQHTIEYALERFEKKGRRLSYKDTGNGTSFRGG